MYALKNKLQRSSGDSWDQVQDAMRHPVRTVERRPWATAGIIALILGAVTFVWLFPELRRYLRIERM